MGKSWEQNINKTLMHNMPKIIFKMDLHNNHLKRIKIKFSKRCRRVSGLFKNICFMAANILQI